MHCCLYFRQKDLQRQIEKTTDLVRLIVQKMEIHTEIESDDVIESYKSEHAAKMKKFHQTFQTARRFMNTGSTNGNISTMFSHTENT